MAFAAVPAEAPAQVTAPEIQSAIKSAGGGGRDVRAFYKARGHRPLWIRGASIGPEADRLIALLEAASLDGLDPDDYRPRSLAEAVDKARGGSPKALAKAEMLLSRRFTDYVRDMRRQRDGNMVYVDRELAPTVPTARAVLQAAAAAPSLRQHLEDAGWMHPVYGQLRQALAAHGVESRVHIPAGPILRAGSTGDRVRLLRMRLGMYPEGRFDESVANALREFQGAHGLPRDGLAGPRTLAALNGGSAEQRQILRVNLERARALPANPGRRYILVDAAAARLWMYEDGKVKDTMRVVVGKPSEQTPMMAALIRYTMVNPYWNIPPDLVQKKVAPGVLSEGHSYLRSKRYEILSGWTNDAQVVHPAAVDWRAVAAGRRELRVRQLPGPDNAMGKMKFMFPNQMGIYLHDTPEKELLRESDRLFSSGCVRVENAARLAKWLYGRPLEVRAGGPERPIPLPEPVPVYITYLTAAPEDGGIAFRPDVYNRDAVRMAGLPASRLASR